MRLKLVALLLVVVANNEVRAQNYPIYNGYFLNPFIYNPAAAATDRTQIFAGYRRQWFGIPGAPSISSLTATSLLDDHRAGLGFRVSTFSRGILNSTDASFAYAYGVPLDKNNKLYFGLSGGVLTNTLNLSDVSNASDPALANVSTSLLPSASFGMMFKSTSGLNLGFVLPKLVSMPQLDSKYSFSYFDNMIVTASFSKWQPSTTPAKKSKGRSYRSKRNANTTVPLELFSIYRYSTYGGLYEVTGKYNFNANIWLSATYRQYAGIIPGIGIVTNNVSFTYFYEPGVGGDLPLKTHEVLLNITLGKNKKFREKKIVPPPSKIATTTQPKVVPPVKKEPEKKTVPVAKAPVTQPKTQPKDTSSRKANNAVTTTQPKVVAPVQAPVQQPQNKNQAPAVKPSIPQQKHPQDSAVASHQPRFKKGADPLAVQPTTTVDTASLNQKHIEERKQLDKHIEEHAEGKHDDAHNEPVNQRHDFVKRGTHHEELEIATYVIAGAFQSRANAEHYVKTLKSLGYKDADFGHLSVRNLWYVFIAEEAEIPDARKARNELQKNRIFKDVWLLTVQE